MIPYLLCLVAIIVLYGLCNSIKDDRGKRYFLVVVTILLALFYGLRRWDVGSDTASYIEMFLKDGAQPLKELWGYMWKQKSPLYVLAEWIFYLFLPVPQLWLLATSLFFFVCLSRFIYNNSEDPLFSYILFFTVFGSFQMTGVRQSLAMGVLVLAYEEIKNKRFFRYTLIVLCAFLLHQTAIIFLPLYFLMRRRVHFYDIAILFGAIVPIYINRNFIFNYIKQFTSYSYFEELNHAEPINFSIMIYGFTLVGYILCLLLWKKYKRYKDNQLPQSDDLLQQTKEYSSFVDAMYLASLFMPLVAVNGSMRRIVMYFGIFLIIFVPKAIKEMLGNRVKILVNLAMGLFLTFLFLRGISGSSYEYHLFFM